MVNEHIGLTWMGSNGRESNRGGAKTKIGEKRERTREKMCVQREE
jgi:hypothetical protein